MRVNNDNLAILNDSLEPDISMNKLKLMPNSYSIKSINEAIEKNYNLVLVNMSNTNLDNYVNLNVDYLGIILLVNDNEYFKIFNLVYDKGIIVVPKSVEYAYLLEIIKLAMISSYKKHMYSDLKKINEIRLMDVAKSIVILRHKKSEDEAHKYIERASMNYRMTLLKTTQIIISNHIRRGISYEY